MYWSVDIHQDFTPSFALKYARRISSIMEELFQIVMSIIQVANDNRSRGDSTGQSTLNLCAETRRHSTTVLATVQKARQDA